MNYYAKWDSKLFLHLSMFSVLENVLSDSIFSLQVSCSFFF